MQPTYNATPCADSFIYGVPLTLLDMHCARLEGIPKPECYHSDPHSGQGTGGDTGK